MGRSRGSAACALAVLAAGLPWMARAAAPGEATDPGERRPCLGAVLPTRPGVDTDELARELLANPSAVGVAARLAPIAAKSLAAGGAAVADRIAAPGNGLDVELKGSRELKSWLSADLAVGNHASGATLGARSGLAMTSFSVGAEGESRSLTASFDLGRVAKADPHLEVHSVLRLKLNYRTNRDYFLAVASLPGQETVLSAMERILPGSQDLHTAPLPVNAGMAAVEAVKRTIAPTLERFQNYESITTGRAVEVVYHSLPGEKPGSGFAQGTVKISYGEMERIPVGPGAASPTRYHEAALGFGAGAGAVGGYSGGVNLAITHTDDPAAQERDPTLNKIADWVRGGQSAPEVLHRTSNPVTDRPAIRTSMSAIMRSPEGSAPGTDSLSVAGDPKLGGVLVSFDPSLLGGTVPPAATLDLFRRLARAVGSGMSNLSFRREQGTERLSLLSLADWQRSGEATLAPLTRIRGYVLRPDDVVLIGETEAHAAPIPGDVLRACLQMVYRQGERPGVSLDPDRSNPVELQRPRLTGIRSALAETEMVRTMLDADYDMKRINLGELPVDVPGFRSHYRIAQTTANPMPGWRRFWLTPMLPGAGDVMEDGPVVLFRSGVQVRTEAMRMVDGLLAPTGTVAREDQEAAENLTSYYPQIEREVPNFRALHAVFDAAKLCALLRYRKVESPVLDRIAAEPLMRVRPTQEGRASLLDPYPGIGPKVVEGTLLWLSGGAVADVTVEPSLFARVPGLRTLAEGGAGASLPSQLQLSPRAAGAALIEAATRDFMEERYSAAVLRSSQALSMEPGSVHARFLRALANSYRGQYGTARTDLDALVTGRPQLLAMRGLVRAGAGDLRGAQEDARSAKSHEGKILSCWLRLRAGDWDGARKEAGDDAAMARIVGTLRRLPPAEAQRMVREEMELPFALQNALSAAEAGLQSGDTVVALAQGRRCLRLLEELGKHPAAQAQHCRERALFILARACQTAERTALRPQSKAYEQQLLAARPGWPTPYILQAFGQLASSEKKERAKAPGLLLASLRRDSTGDPLFREWRLAFGAESVVAPSLLTSAAIQCLSAGDDPSPYLQELSKLPGVDGRIAAAMVRQRWFTGPDQIPDVEHPDPAARRRAAEMLRALGELPTDAARAPIPPAIAPIFLRSTTVFFDAGLEAAAGRPDAGLEPVRSLLRHLPSGENVDEMVSPFLSRAVWGLSQILSRRILPDEEATRLVAQISRGEKPLAELRKRIRVSTDAAAEESRPGDSPFVHTMVGVLLRFEARRLVRDLLRRIANSDAASDTLRTEAGTRRDQVADEWVHELETADTHFPQWLAAAHTGSERAALPDLLGHMFTGLELPEARFDAVKRRLDTETQALQALIRGL